MKYRSPAKLEQPGHIDDWLMTYADMITLLLCFFVVLLVVSITKKETPHEAPVRPQVVNVVTAPPVPQKDEDPPSALPDVFRNRLPFHKIEPADFPAVDHPAQEAAVETAVPPALPPPENVAPAPVIADVPVTAPSLSVLEPPADSLKAQGPVNVEQKGDRITTLEINSAAFFDSGSAVLSVAGQVILEGVADKLKAEQYRDYKITVEGHTDDTPIKTAQFPSNWELSTARAAAVVRFFVEQGLPADKLRAAGYADTFPKLPNRDANGNPIPLNQAQNRRVIITLEKIERAQ